MKSNLIIIMLLSVTAVFEHPIFSEEPLHSTSGINLGCLLVLFVLVFSAFLFQFSKQESNREIGSQKLMIVLAAIAFATSFLSLMSKLKP